MKIKEIYYEESFKTTKNFNSHGKAVGYAVGVGDDEEPDAVFVQLKQLVQSKLVETDQSKTVESSNN